MLLPPFWLSFVFSFPLLSIKVLLFGKLVRVPRVRASRRDAVPASGALHPERKQRLPPPLVFPPRACVIRLFQGFGIALHAAQCGVCCLLGSWRSSFFQVWNLVLVQGDVSIPSPGRWAEPHSTLGSSFLGVGDSALFPGATPDGIPTQQEGTQAAFSAPALPRQHLPLSQGWKSIYCPALRSFAGV